MKDVVIVGAGPAGLSAAVYTSRAGFSTLVVQGESAGGLLTTTEQIDNYLGMFGSDGNAMAENFMEHAGKFGAEFLFDKVVNVVRGFDGVFTVVLESGDSVVARTVIYAAGSTPRKLGVPGENLNGISYCATCDGMFFEDEKVIVVGGGETAVEDALYLSNIVKHVDVFVRSNFRATEPAVRKLLEQENVTVHLNENVTEITGDEEGDITGVTTTLGNKFEATGVFIAVGQSPNSEAAGENVTLLDDGFIEYSKNPGFFVAGDVSVPDYRQVVVAAGDGAKAGISATRYLLN